MFHLFCYAAGLATPLQRTLVWTPQHQCALMTNPNKQGHYYAANAHVSQDVTHVATALEDDFA